MTKKDDKKNTAIGCFGLIIILIIAGFIFKSCTKEKEYTADELKSVNQIETACKDVNPDIQSVEKLFDGVIQVNFRTDTFDDANYGRFADKCIQLNSRVLSKINKPVIIMAKNTFIDDTGKKDVLPAYAVQYSVSQIKNVNWSNMQEVVGKKGYGKFYNIGRYYIVRDYLSSIPDEDLKEINEKPNGITY